MESLLLNLMYFFRPIMSMYVDKTFFGFEYSDIVTMIFSICLALVAIVSSMDVGRARHITTIEKWMILFILWSSLASLQHYNVVDFRTYIKWILPPLTYMVMRRAITSKEQYIRLLLIMVAGYSIPIVASAYKTAEGLGLHVRIYWTGLERYNGVYAKVHDLGHNMAFVIMMLAILYFVTNGNLLKNGQRLKKGTLIVISCLILLALYNMYSAQVRTVYVGIVLFGMILLYLRSKKGLIVYIAAGVVAVVFFSATVYTIFFDVVDAVEGKEGPVSIGSGRFEIWEHNLDVYSELSIPDKILGVGIGNQYGTVDWKSIKTGEELVFDSHNDWLTVLMATGPPGFVLMLGIYWSFYTRIRQLYGGEKAVFLAFFLSVVIMNVASNSYITRFPLAQSFYMLMVYLELKFQVSANVAVKPEVVKQYNPRILALKKDSR